MLLDGLLECYIFQEFKYKGEISLIEESSQNEASAARSGQPASSVR